MGGPHKQRYVTMIMSLPQDIQNTFFYLIDSSKRTGRRQYVTTDTQSTITQLEIELRNAQADIMELKAESSDLLRKNKSLQRELKELREKLYMYEE